ncbi:hypothetical protein DM02DRAFT_670839 [Periconia macrospinosa]|uniref:DUF7730 domain-containing protein n=1 Tax=Periconia macrospinosa TaxID=97972 RepID=A0A2V1DVI1_9PLEO|nr:hypothetical protein DM02DRAFT_670839 [Periconia macrospinosa]
MSMIVASQAVVNQAVAPQPVQQANAGTKKRVRKPKPKAPQTPFRFLDLPAEIRNMIYKRVLISNLGPLEFRRRFVGYHGRFQYKITRERQPLHGREDLFNTRILETCKQINAEASMVLYQGNEFRFKTPGHLDFFIEKWPAAIKHIRHVRFKMETASSPVALAAFKSLCDADALERLDIEWDVKDKCVAVHMPFIVAEFWRHAFLFFRHHMLRTGNCEAALDLMNFVGPSDEKLYERVRVGLAGLMRLNDEAYY